jgi:hypothetical protein
MAYLHRKAEPTLTRYLKRFPVVGVSGPRQSGKSTLIQHELPHYNYVTFDSIRNVDYFGADPEGFMQTYSGNVIFDEVQYVPDIFRYIKHAVDKNRKKNGQFVLTGSAQFSFLARVSESLAGRIGIFSVLPLQFAASYVFGQLP